MKCSVSNIAWDKEHDDHWYGLLRQYGFDGLEIAPTRIVPLAPYEQREQARVWSQWLRQTYALTVPSMQSIWYGRQEQLFADAQQRAILLQYTKDAILFAEAIGCNNLVFGCPKNRCTTSASDQRIGASFFAELAAYAARHHTVIGLEANPPAYGTNYLNTTQQVIALVRDIDCPGLRLNLDIGAMCMNEETVDCLANAVGLVSHVHLSAPNLQPIAAHPLHAAIIALLRQEHYTGFVSIEMRKPADADTLCQAMAYCKTLLTHEEE